MSRWPIGERTVTYLLERGRLEDLGDTDLEAAAGVALARAQRRLRTAAAGLDADDPDGAYAAAYDAYRMAAEALLVRQGLRASGGDGSHVTVEDAIGAQFSDRISAFAKPTFERLRRTRHRAQYFDPSAPPIEPDDAQWAVQLSSRAVQDTALLLDTNPPGRFTE